MYIYSIDLIEFKDMLLMWISNLLIRIILTLKISAVRNGVRIGELVNSKNSLIC